MGLLTHIRVVFPSGFQKPRTELSAFGHTPTDTRSHRWQPGTGAALCHRCVWRKAHRAPRFADAAWLSSARESSRFSEQAERWSKFKEVACSQPPALTCPLRPQPDFFHKSLDSLEAVSGEGVELVAGAFSSECLAFSMWSPQRPRRAPAAVETGHTPTSRRNIPGSPWLALAGPLSLKGKAEGSPVRQMYLTSRKPSASPSGSFLSR